MKVDSGKNPLLKRIEKRNWIILVLMATTSLFLLPSSFSLGVIFGGLISILSYHGLTFAVIRAFNPPSHEARGILILWFYIRLTLIAVVLGFLIYHQLVDFIALIIGLSVVVLSIILTTLLDNRKIRLGV